MYTGEFLDYTEIDRVLKTLEDIPVDAGQPPHNFNLLRHIYHHGVPQKAHYECSRKDMFTRNLYNNHRAIHPKVASDIQNSNAIALPRWVLFIYPIG